MSDNIKIAIRLSEIIMYIIPNTIEVIICLFIMLFGVSCLIVLDRVLTRPYRLEQRRKKRIIREKLKKQGYIMYE